MPVPAPVPEAAPAPAPGGNGETWTDWRAFPGDDGPGEPDGKPDAGKGAEEKPDPAWPGIDDDPSFDREDGSGDWCGTGMRGPPYGGPGIDGLELWRLDGSWSRVDGSGLLRRLAREPLPDDERRRLEARIEELWQEMVATKDDAELRRLAVERARLELRLERGDDAWIQYGLKLDGVLYTSTRDEGRLAFVKRARAEAAAQRKAEAQRGGADPGQGATTQRPDPEADADAGRTWSGPDKNGFWRRLAEDPRDEVPSFGSGTFLQYGLERDGVFYMAKPGESVDAFVARVEREAAAKAAGK